jgi:diacylglycerol kinase family enzyme
VPLGILPLGTLHHFAKDLGLPLDIDGAVQVIAAARTRDVDVAEVNGRVFINNASIGIHPCMVVDRNRRRSTDGLGKWLAMALAFLRMLWRFPRRRLSIRTEGWTAPRRTPCLLIGNNEYGIELLTLGRRNRLDAGELWLFVATPRHSRALRWFAVRAAFGGLNPGEDFATLRTKAVEEAREPDARGARWRGGDDAAAPGLPCPAGGAPRVRPRTTGKLGGMLPCG